MKTRYITIAFLFSLIFGLTSCDSKEDPIFSESSSERIAATMEKNRDILLASEHGWNLKYNTESGAVFNFIFKFIDDENVVMECDFVEGTSTSTWKITAGESAILSFDTYSYLHVLADPSLSPAGKGLEGDFEFIFGDAFPDEVQLIGRKHKGMFMATKATEEDWHIIQKLRIVNDMFGNSQPMFRVIKDNENKTVGTFLYRGGRTYDIYYTNADGQFVRNNGIDYEITLDGINLATPFVINGIEVSQITIDDNGLGTLVGTDMTLTTSNRPSIYPGAFEQYMVGTSKDSFFMIDASEKVNDVFYNLRVKFLSILGYDVFYFWSTAYNGLTIYSSKGGDDDIIMVALAWARFLGDPEIGSDYVYLIAPLFQEYLSVGLTDEEEEEIGTSDEFKAIFGTLNKDGLGGVIIPIDDKSYYYMSLADNDIWIQYSLL